MRMIYSQTFVNFKILWENGNEMAKGEWTNEKGNMEHWKLAQKSPKLALERSLQRNSSKTLAQASSLL